MESISDGDLLVFLPYFNLLFYNYKNESVAVILLGILKSSWPVGQGEKQPPELFYKKCCS